MTAPKPDACPTCKNKKRPGRIYPGAVYEYCRDPWHDSKPEAGKAGDGGLQSIQPLQGQRRDESPARQPSEPADPLHDEIEKAMRAKVNRQAATIWIEDAVSVAESMIQDELDLAGKRIHLLTKRAEAAEKELNVLRMTQDESDECAADLFSLVCSVLDGKPDAVGARARLKDHIDHVNACRKGSCATELHGSRLRQERDEARKALAEYRENVLKMLDGFQQEVQIRPAHKDWTWDKVNDLVCRIKIAARCAPPEVKP